MGSQSEDNAATNWTSLGGIQNIPRQTVSWNSLNQQKYIWIALYWLHRTKEECRYWPHRRIISCQKIGLVGGFNPSEKYESQIGSSSPIWLGKIKFMVQTTKEWSMLCLQNTFKNFSWMLKICWGPFLNAAQNPSRFPPFQLDVPIKTSSTNRSRWSNLVNSLQLTRSILGERWGSIYWTLWTYIELYPLVN